MRFREAIGSGEFSAGMRVAEYDNGLPRWTAARGRAALHKWTDGHLRVHGDGRSAGIFPQRDAGSGIVGAFRGSRGGRYHFCRYTGQGQDSRTRHISIVFPLSHTHTHTQQASERAHPFPGQKRVGSLLLAHSGGLVHSWDGRMGKAKVKNQAGSYTFIYIVFKMPGFLLFSTGDKYINAFSWITSAKYEPNTLRHS